VPMFKNASNLMGFMAVASLALATQTAHAATPEAKASFDATNHVFRLDGGDVTYAFGVNAQGALESAYWGARLGAGDPLPRPKGKGRAFEMDDTPQEFAGWGGGLLAEPSLKVSFPDGNRDLVLHYVSHEIKDATVSVVLRCITRSMRIRAFLRGALRS